MNKNYIFNNMRISVLKDNILRFEYAPNQNYTNEETIFIKNLIKNSKEVVWWGEHGRKSGLSLQGDFAMCKGSCTLVNGFSGSRPGRDGKKTKASVRRPRASGKEGLVYA